MLTVTYVVESVAEGVGIHVTHELAVQIDVIGYRLLTRNSNLVIDIIDLQPVHICAIVVNDGDASYTRILAQVKGVLNI